MACVTVTVMGPTGSGKSRILGEIEIALKAIGVSVRWADADDRRSVNSEHWAEATGGWQPDFPVVVLKEINVPISPKKPCAR
ncbi:MAG TPA: hypothetical protein VMS01_04350 [Stellaceae bacterium]|nr:hypothetical protein [Stellaceae bacterium]